jgi:transposase InsO family protein
MLKAQIESVLACNPAYGHRRIALALGIGKKRVRRVMKLYHLKPYKRKARWRKRQDERRPEAAYENHIKGICPLRPNIIYVCDFTYIRYRQRFVYLATYMDLFSREIIGWHVSATHTKDLVTQAFWDALMNTGQVPKIVHSDQGSEYTSEDYTQLLTKLGITISMSKKSSPWENAFQESFYNNFKTDLGLEFDRFEGIGELVEAIHQTIAYYNNERIHTSLKMSPSQFRLLYTK